MPESFLVVLNQVTTLFLLIAAGYAVTKIGLVTKLGTSQMTNVLLMLVTPAVIINAFEIPFDASKLVWLGVSAASAAATHILGILVGKMFFRKSTKQRQPVFRFAVMYSNCGFMALPLIQAVAGSEGVFYGSVYVVVFNIFVWTHGVALMSGEKKGISITHVLVNPGVIGTFAAMLLFFFSLSLPAFVSEAVKMLANLNTPLAMMVIGALLANVKLSSAFLQKETYLVAFLRLIIIPLTVVFVLRFLDIPEPLYKACVISAAAPVGANTSLFAMRFLKDAELAGELITLSTAFSIITLPLLLYVSLVGA